MRPEVFNKGRGAALGDLRLGRVVRRRMPAVGAGEGRMSAWADSFLYGGTSSLLLLVTDLFPTCWYLSFFALTPFLYKVSRADRAEALRLGFLLGLTFFGVRVANSVIVAPLHAAALLVCGTAALALFGWILSRAREAWGFNPLVVALVWVIFELGLIRVGLVRGVFPGAELGAGFLYKAAILFGFLAVSFVIVLFNSILIAAVNAVVSLARARGVVVSEGEGIWDLLSTPGLVAQRLLLVAEGRGPPAALDTGYACQSEKREPIGHAPSWRRRGAFHSFDCLANASRAGENRWRCMMSKCKYVLRHLTQVTVFVTVAIVVSASSLFASSSDVYFNTNFTNTTGSMANDFHVKLCDDNNITIGGTWSTGPGCVPLGTPTITGNGTKCVTLDWGGGTVNQGDSVHVGAWWNTATNSIRFSECWWTIGGIKMVAAPPRPVQTVFSGPTSLWRVARVDLYSDAAGLHHLGTQFVQGQGDSAVFSNRFSDVDIYARWAFNTPSAAPLPLSSLNTSLGGFPTPGPLTALPRRRVSPALTPYGLLALVVLLAGTAAWVVKKRRAALAR